MPDLMLNSHRHERMPLRTLSELSLCSFSAMCQAGLPPMLSFSVQRDNEQA